MARLHADRAINPKHLRLGLKRVLAREAWCKLPGFIQVLAKRLYATKIWFPQEGYTLPPTCPIQEVHDAAEATRYVDYVKTQLDAGERDTGKLRSFQQGLRSCGAPGQQLSETIKKKVLRK